MKPWKPDPNRWAPQAHQENWMRSPAFELCVGGAAGPGKSAFLLVEALRHIHRRGYLALILRREAVQLRKELIPAAQEIYPRLGGRWRASDMTFTFPSGARIMLGGVEAEQDVRKYSGASLQYLGWDELTHFTEWQYVFMFARCRVSGLCPDVTPRVRSGTNPGGVGHEWVLARWAPWLYPRPGHPHHDGTYKGRFADPGEILAFKRDDAGVDREVPIGTPGAMTRSFMPARVQDNAIYAGTSYEHTLAQLSLLDRLQLLDGNWMARAAAGMFFKRAWFKDKILRAAPVQVAARVRYWDLAATPAQRARKGGAWTSGLLISRRADKTFVIEHVVRGQWSPGEVEATVGVTAKTDPKGTRVVIERDPGQAGTAQAASYTRELAEFDIHAVPPQGDKVTRCKPASAAAEAGNILLVEGDWNAAFLQEAEQFPEGTMDQIDSLSGGYNQITQFPGYRVRPRGERETGSSKGAF